MGKVNRSISQKVQSKKGVGHSLEKLERNVFKAGQKKPGSPAPTVKKILPIVSKRKTKIPSVKTTMANKKKNAISSSSKPEEVLLQMNLALPPTCSFLVQTPSSDPSVACFEGPGVSIKLPIKQDSTGQTARAKKDAPKMIRTQKK